MALVKLGGLPVLFEGDPLRLPWWWSDVVQIWTRIQSIREAASYDVDRMMAPKDYWLNAKALDEWFEERRKKAAQPKTLDDY